MKVIKNVRKNEEGNGTMKKKVLKILGIIFAIILAVLVITFILEKPQMDIQTIEHLEVKSGKIIKKPKTIYHFKDITDEVKITGDIDYDRVGEYTIQYEVDTLIGKYTKSETLEIVDTIPPEITLEGDTDYKQSYSKEYEEPGYKAIDEYDGDITEKVETIREDIDELNYNIKYIVKDSSKNEAEKIRKITIIDDVPPTITLNGNDIIYMYVGENYNEAGAKAIDEKEGDLSSNIEIEGKVDTTNVGTYTITYKSTDSVGNEGVSDKESCS